MKTTLTTPYAVEKAGAILGLIDGLEGEKVLDKLEQIISVADFHLDSDFASEDTRYHWAEIRLIAEDFIEQLGG